MSKNPGLPELRRKFDAARKRWKALSDANKQSGDALRKADDLALTILQTPARTLPGVQLKQRAIKHLDPSGVDCGWWELVARSLERDLVRLLKNARPAPRVGAA